MKYASIKPWVIWSLGAMVFLVAYGPRVSMSVMQPELMKAFSINAFGFGSLTAFFLYAYVPMQVPVGMLVDRFGARKLLYTMATLAGVGCFIFAGSHHLAFAKLARFVLGFGSSFGFVCALKLAKDWFPDERFGLLAGFTQALGMLGAAFGEAPIAHAVDSWGWRSTMGFFGIVFVILAVFIFIFVRDKEKVQDQVVAQVGLVEGLVLVLKNKQSWINAFYLGLAYAPIMAFGEAWGVSFLQTAYGASKEIAAMAVGLMFLGWGIGGPIIGAYSDKMRRRKPMMIMTSVTGALLLAVIIFYVHLPIWLLYVCTFLAGFLNTGVGVAYALSGEINARNIAGTSMAFANMASIIIGMALEPFIGWLLDIQGGTLVDGVYHYSLHAYQMALLILPAGMVLSLLFAVWVKETNCHSIESIVGIANTDK